MLNRNVLLCEKLEETSFIRANLHWYLIRASSNGEVCSFRLDRKISEDGIKMWRCVASQQCKRFPIKGIRSRRFIKQLLWKNQVENLHCSCSLHVNVVCVVHTRQTLYHRIVTIVCITCIVKLKLIITIITIIITNYYYNCNEVNNICYILCACCRVQR